MYLQCLMLLAVDQGLACCAQEVWAMFPHTVAAFLGSPVERIVFCGVAIGWEDVDALVNRLSSDRAPAGEWPNVVA